METEEQRVELGRQWHLQKINQLFLAYIWTFPENWNKIHALVFEKPCKKHFLLKRLKLLCVAVPAENIMSCIINTLNKNPYFDFKVGLKSMWVVVPPKINQLLLTHILTFPESLNEMHAVVLE